MATDVGVLPGRPCNFNMWAIRHVSHRFRLRLSKRRSGRQNAPGAVRSIFGSGNPKLESGGADVHIVASWSGDFVCSMMQSEMKPGGLSARERHESGSSARVELEYGLNIHSFSGFTSHHFSSPCPARTKSWPCPQLQCVTGKSTNQLIAILNIQRGLYWAACHVGSVSAEEILDANPARSSFSPEDFGFPGPVAVIVPSETRGHRPFVRH